jgi:hypothetical protein
MNVPNLPANIVSVIEEEEPDLGFLLELLEEEVVSSCVEGCIFYSSKFRDGDQEQQDWL